MPAVERTWRPGYPVDLVAILGPLSRGPRYRTFRFERLRGTAAPVVWWATSTPDGPGTLRIVGQPGDGSVRATSWGPGAPWLLDGVPTLLGATDVPGDFTPAHPVVAEAFRRVPGWRMLRTRRPFDACVVAVIEQKVTGYEAMRAWQSLVRQFGEPAPGPAPDGMAVPPSAKQWRSISDADFHRAGVTPHRIRTLRVVASAAAAIERTAELSGADADQILRALPGVGIWTSAETRQRAHGDADAVSFGDFHVAKDICWWLTGERGDDARMAELLEPYAGHRYRVQRLMELAGAGAPRRGPRMAVPQHRGW